MSFVALMTDQQTKRSYNKCWKVRVIYRHRKKSDLFLNKWSRKSLFHINVAYKRTVICNYKEASLLKTYYGFALNLEYALVKTEVKHFYYSSLIRAPLSLASKGERKGGGKRCFFRTTSLETVVLRQCKIA